MMILKIKTKRDTIRKKLSKFHKVEAIYYEDIMNELIDRQKYFNVNDYELSLHFFRFYKQRSDYINKPSQSLLMVVLLISLKIVLDQLQSFF